MSCYLLGRNTVKKGVEGVEGSGIGRRGNCHQLVWRGFLAKSRQWALAAGVSSYQNCCRWSHLQQQIGVSLRSRM